MAKIFTLNGLVRSAEIQHKNADHSVWGTRMTVLSEPKGDTVEVTVFSRAMDPSAVVALEGAMVSLIVEVEVVAGRTGGAFMNVSLVKVVNSELPVAAGIAIPTSEPTALVGGDVVL
jgi:hypothetical protein